jgi:Heat induced stress protein YflT
MVIKAQGTVIGVFDDRGLADTAVGELQNAGFSSDQIYYSGPEEGHAEDHLTDFWQGIKRFFLHGKRTSHDPLAKELNELGLTDDEIDHYENEYHIGRIIVAVKAPGREEEALAILHENGAHD